MALHNANESSVNNKTVLIKWQPLCWALYTSCAVVLAIPNHCHYMNDVPVRTHMNAHAFRSTYVWHSCTVTVTNRHLQLDVWQYAPLCGAVAWCVTRGDRSWPRRPYDVISIINVCKSQTSSVFSWSTRIHKSYFRMRTGYALQDRPILCKFITIIHLSLRPSSLLCTICTQTRVFMRCCRRHAILISSVDSDMHARTSRH